MSPCSAAPLLPGGRLLAAAPQLGLGLPGHLPRAGGPGRPFLVPRVGRFEAAGLRGQRRGQRPGVICLHLVVRCFGVGRLLPGVGADPPGQAQLAAHIPRRRRLRAFTVEHPALQLAPGHGPELGLLADDLQRPDRAPAQGFELGGGMRVQADRLLRAGDPPRLPVRRSRASPPRVSLPAGPGRHPARVVPRDAGSATVRGSPAPARRVPGAGRRARRPARAPAPGRPAASAAPTSRRVPAPATAGAGGGRAGRRRPTGRRPSGRR